MTHNQQLALKNIFTIKAGQMHASRKIIRYFSEVSLFFTLQIPKPIISVLQMNISIY